MSRQINTLSNSILNLQSLWDRYFYYLDDSVRLQKLLIKFLASLPGIAKIDIDKKIVLFDLDVIFIFIFICGNCRHLC